MHGRKFLQKQLKSGKVLWGSRFQSILTQKPCWNGSVQSSKAVVCGSSCSYGNRQEADSCQNQRPSASDLLLPAVPHLLKIPPATQNTTIIQGTSIISARTTWENKIRWGPSLQSYCILQSIEKYYYSPCAPHPEEDWQALTRGQLPSICTSKWPIAHLHQADPAG